MASLICSFEKLATGPPSSSERSLPITVSEPPLLYTPRFNSPYVIGACCNPTLGIFSLSEIDELEFELLLSDLVSPFSSLNFAFKALCLNLYLSNILLTSSDLASLISFKAFS